VFNNGTNDGEDQKTGLGKANTLTVLRTIGGHHDRGDGTRGEMEIQTETSTGYHRGGGIRGVGPSLRTTVAARYMIPIGIDDPSRMYASPIL
jgi:hypothetical protein